MNYQEKKEDIEGVSFWERGQTGVLSGHIWEAILAVVDSRRAVV